MISGTIKLMRREEVVQFKVYDSPQDRKKIIEVWAKLYANSFNKCSLQICPSTNEDRISDDGLNNKYVKQKDYATK